ncbi:MAG: hypothetical protein QMD50_02855 [Patescibacteria group bacterium]|nr:hypothetical protein [Patescibacteria group bacterium]
MKKLSHPLKRKIAEKKIVGFDMDGVIIDHTKTRIKLAKKRGFNLKPKETPSDILRTKIPQIERKLIQYFIYNHPATSLRSSLMPRVKNALARFKKSKISYHLISRRKDPELAIKILKLNNLWPVYFNAKNTHFVATPEEKNIKAQALNLTHYVDDEKSVLAELTNVKNRFLFDQYNVLGEGDYVRVKSWPELTKYLLN